MTELKKKVTPIWAKTKVVIDTVYFIVFAYGMYQLSTKSEDLMMALDLIAKK